eukprot:5508042-Pleurochrysis_carterae.AAC.2
MPTKTESAFGTSRLRLDAYLKVATDGKPAKEQNDARRVLRVANHQEPCRKYALYAECSHRERNRATNKPPTMPLCRRGGLDRLKYYPQRGILQLLPQWHVPRI